jgi:hypothetical protein
MPGLDPGIHAFWIGASGQEMWMAGSSPANDDLWHVRHPNSLEFAAGPWSHTGL